MTTSASIRAAWLSAVFNNSSITAITDKIYAYDITLESVKEFSKLRYNQQTNFFLYLVSRAQRVRIMGQMEQIFTVEIRYSKFADVPGVGWAAVADVFETIDSLVSSGLGGSWSNTVDYYRIQDGPPSISQVEMEGLPIWTGSYKYFGYKLTG